MGIEKGTIFLYSVKCRNKTQRKKIPLCLILPQNSSHRYFKVGAAANEFLRSKIEEGINAVLKAELAGFLGYEKHSSAQSSKSNSPMRIHWNGSPAWSTATTTDGSPGKLIADFRKHIRSCWRCSRIEFFGQHCKKFTHKN